MNAMLNIQVRVASQQANAALRNLQGGLNGVHRAAAGGGLAGFMKNLNPSKITNFGKNLQWTGRQLEYNFTLPILLAGGAATKWALDNERAMTSVKKVYGDLSMPASRVKAETDALGKSFELLSNRMGVNQAEVINIGASWAQAGAAGVGLARSVRLTLEAMTLGEMDAMEATQGLIAIQSIYRLNSIELKDALAELNIIENQTGIEFKGLIDVMTRAGGAARGAGIDIRHLGAMAAALVPATGSASQAGNALRTMISRIVAPTKDTIDVLDKMGISVYDASWQASNGVERIELLADAFTGLTQSQQNVVSATVASRWQVSRFNVLMQDIASNTGYYAKALEATSDPTRNMVQYNRELAAVLDSNPKKFDILINTMKNALSSAIIPILPALLAIVVRITNMAQAFANLDPETQQFILTMVGLVAVFGPLIRYTAAFIELIGTLGSVFVFFGKGLWWVAAKAVPFLVSGFLDILAAVGWFVGGLIDKALPVLMSVFRMVGSGMGVAVRAVLGGVGLILRGGFGLLARGFWAITGLIGEIVGGLAALVSAPVWAVVAIIAAVVAAIVLIVNDDLRNGLFDGIRNIGRGIGSLPRLFVDVLMAVLRAVQRIGQAIYDGLQRLNPFARFSPSLVDNVRAGVDVIIDEYGRLTVASTSLNAAAVAHKNFLKATEGGRRNVTEQERNQQRQDVEAYSPGSSNALNVMFANIDRLQMELPALQAQIDQQEASVRDWEQALKNINKTLDQERTKLAAMNDWLDALEANLDEAKSRLDRFANTPITGMREMSDAIFENEMAQKRLRLEIMRVEDAAGGSLDELREKMAALRGEQEMLFGKREDLRMAGAGSEILGVYDEQIKALKDQEKQTQDSLKPILDMQKELERLQRIGEELNLEQSIKFDAQLRQIDQMVNGIEEMSFEDIVAGIKQAQSDTKRWQTEIEFANQKIAEQEQYIAGIEALRDAIAANLDTEQTKLDAMKESYQAIETQIQDMTTAINDFATAAKQAMDDADQSTIEGLFDAGALGDYDLPGGDSIIGPEGDLFDIEQFNKDLEAELAKIGQDMGKLDLFKPLKDAWNKAWEAIKEKTRPLVEPVVGVVRGAVNGVSDAIGMIGRNFSIEGLTNAFGTITGFLTEQVGNIGAIIGGIWSDIIYPPLAALWGFIMDILTPVWNVLSGAVEAAWNGVIAPIISAAWAIIEPVLSALWGFISGYVIPVFELIAAVAEITFTLIWRMVEFAWNNIGPILRALWDFIANVLIVVFQTLGEIVSTVWNDGIVPIIQIAVGLIMAVLQAVWWFITNVLGPVFGWLYNTIIQPTFNLIGDVIGTVWRDGILPIFEQIDNVLRTVVGPAFEWLRDHIISPVFGAIRTTIETVFNSIMGTIETAVNFFIDAFNFLARGVNSIGDLLNIDVNVTEMERIRMPRMGGNGGGNWAGGGSDQIGLFARGGITSGISIAGEGRYPEYVIPTDPAYRDRAKMLLGKANDEIGGWGVIGDVIQRGKDAVSGVIGGVRRGAAAAAFAPFDALAMPMINKIGPPFVKSIAQSIRNELYNFVAGMESGLEAGSFGSDKVDGTGHRAITRWLRDNYEGDFRVTSTMRPGDLGYHGKGRAADFAGPHPGVDTPTLLKINRAFLPIAGTLKELIYSGPGGQSYKNGQPSNYSAAVRADHHDHVHAALATGGIVTRATTALVGEAGPEAVLPLDVLFQRLDLGFVSIVNQIKTLDASEALRSARLETSILDRFTFQNTLLETNFDGLITGIDLSLDEVNSHLAPVVENLADLISKADDITSAIETMGDEIVMAITSLEQVQQESNSGGGGSGGSSGGGSVAVPGGGYVSADFANWFAGQSPIVQGDLVMLGPDFANWWAGGGSSTYKMATGGIVRARPGGIWANIGEGGQDEAVIPLPADGSLGSRTMNFYGDLSFPNITDGDDAEELIRNLEAMAD